LTQARNLYHQFHCFAAPALRRFPCQRTNPNLLVDLGELRGLIYRSDRGTCGKPATFIHFLETPARLTCDPPGKQLYILGGQYRITARGIEG